MAKTIQYTFKINGVDTTAKSIADLESTIEQLNEEISQVALGSEDFKTLSEQIRNANSAMQNLEKTLEGADTVKVAESFAKLGEGIAGGFAIATSAAGLFGSESEDLAKAEAKAQQAIAVVMGARAIAESVVEGATAARLIKEKAMLAVQNLSIINTKVMTFLFGQQTVATATQAVATEGATVAQKALNLAMKMSPIGLLIAGLTALVAAVAYFSESNTDAADSQAKLNDEMLLSMKMADERSKALIRAADFEIDKLKARGAGEQRLIQEQQKRLQLEIELAKTAEGRALQGINQTKRQLEGLDAESETYKKLREQLDGFTEQAKTAAEKREELSRKTAIVAITEAERLKKAGEEAGKKAAEDRIKAEDEAKKKREEKLAAELKLNDEIALSQIERIKDEETRELDKLRFDNDKKVEEIKNSKASAETKAAALKELDLKYQNDSDAITEKYRLKRIEDEKKATEDAKNLKLQALTDENNLQQAKYDNEIILAEDNKLKILEIQKEKLDAQYQAELEAAKLKGEDTKLIEQKYANDSLLLSKQTKEQQKKDREDEYNENLKTANDLNNGLQALSDFAFEVKKTNLQKGSEEEEKAARQQFKINKSVQLSSAFITGTQAVLEAFANGMKNPVPLLGPATAAVYASIAGVTAAANIAKIASTKFESTSGSLGATAPSSGPTPSLTTAIGGNMLTAPTMSQFKPETINKTGTISGQGSGDASAQRVYVLESDITKTQKKVQTVENLASF